MNLTRRNALLSAGAGMLLAPDHARAATPATAVQAALQAALDAFFAGWSSGNWQLFLDHCDDAMIFQFPVGEQRGRHGPPDGKHALAAWTAAHRKGGNRITRSTVDLKLFADDWLIVCDRGSGTIRGAPYSGLHAIFLRANDAGKIVEFREYFGEIA